MNRLFFLFSAPLFLACGSFPQNDKEARPWFKSSSDTVRLEYAIPSLELDAAEQKLRAFTDKCLMKSITHTTVGNGHRSGYSTTLKPRFIKGKAGVTLIVQRDVKEMNYIGVPESGRYDLMVEISSGPKGVQVFSSRIRQWGDLSLGNVLEDLETWIKGADQFCPKVG